jgi:peptidoglycan/LPS O-acetylase OafA/YrhL
MNPEEHSGYRPDIDGLRAIAVAGVVLFHARPSALPGGFVGVDVFFVISGFLISGMIYARLSRGTFTIRDFYARRVRRIFPALGLVLLVTWLLGWRALFADELVALGKHMAAGAGFLANIKLWREAGYFDTSAELKPLQHLWSLGVEEQFYIFWPVLAAVVFRFGIPFLAVAVGLGALSFVLNLAMVDHHASTAFFLLPTRFWELAMGAALAAVPRGRLPFGQEDAVSTIGLALIVASMFLVTGGAGFPGWRALPPTLGALLVIGAGPAAWPNRLLASRALVFLGLISYPLYLWHWPLLSFARIAEFGAPSQGILLAAVALSVLLAWVTYRWLEKPVRFGAGRKHPRATVAALCVTMGCAGLLGLWTVHKRGFSSRLAPESIGARASLTLDGAAGGLVKIGGCPLSEKDARLAMWCQADVRQQATRVVWGDSKSQALFPGLVRESKDGQRWTLIGLPGCAPLSGVGITDPTQPECDAFNAAALSGILAHEDLQVVLLVFGADSIEQSVKLSDRDGRPGSHEDLVMRGLTETVTRLRQAHRQVVILLDNPNITREPLTCAATRPLRLGSAKPACAITRDRHEADLALFRRAVAKLRLELPEVSVFDPTDLLCHGTTCAVMDGNRSLYSYAHHFSDVGNTLVASHLLASFEERR